jgi:hypothetical protein
MVRAARSFGRGNAVGAAERAGSGNGGQRPGHRCRPAVLVAVHVWTVDDAAGTALRIAQQAAERSLAGALGLWRRAYPQVEVDRLLLRAVDVAYALERASGRGRMLVAGTGRNGRCARRGRGRCRPVAEYNQHDGPRRPGPTALGAGTRQGME